MAESDSQEFEDSAYFDDSREAKKERQIENQPFDEALDVSASLDQSYGGPLGGLSGPGAGSGGRQPRQLHHERFDEALDVSASMDVKDLDMRMRAGEKQEKDKALTNNPFDEAHDLAHSDDDSIDTTVSAKKGAKLSHAVGGKAGGALAGAKAGPGPGPGPGPAGPGSPDTEASEGEEEGSEGGERPAFFPNAYDPEDYAHLQVSADVRELFKYIDRYKAVDVELETPLMCFIPDYIPAVGEMDAFLKVPRPDGEPDGLGLKVLDEPSSTQSDPTVLELQLRATSKKAYGDVSVRSIEGAARNPQEIERWVRSISELHRNKPPPRVHYRRPMPDVEALMEAWPEDFEAALSRIPLPSTDLDLSTEEYVRVVCGLLDIPVNDNPVESLHVLFTLYSAFRNNPHFIAMQQRAQGAPPPDAQHDYYGADVMTVDRDEK